MTEREKEIYEVISENPTLSQEDISQILDITRSSVSVHISNLMKKGHILGKGYVLKNNPYVVVIGGSNIDIEGYPHNSLKMEDSNPGVVKISFGGVGRNIAENLALLGVDTKLISVVGDDNNGSNLINYCKTKGIDTNHLETINNATTSTYLSILGEDKDMKVAISHMDITDHITKEMLERKKSIIANASICVLDTNLPKESIEYLLNNFDIPFVIDPVSLEKSKKLENLYNKIDTFKPNLIEAENITGIKANSKKEITKIGESIFNLGIRNLFISLGADGVYYKNSEKEGFVSAPFTDVASVTGAGDAFLSGSVLAKSLGQSIEEQVIYGVANSLCSLETFETIPDDLSIKKLETKLEEVKKCNFTKNI